MSKDLTAPYSTFIQDLPKAALPMAGVTGHLLASDNGQVVLFEIPAGSTVPPHSHGAQWGIMVSGRMQLTIGGQTHTYTKGDSYEIPAGVEHSAVIEEDSRVIDVFADAGRYQVRD